MIKKTPVKKSDKIAVTFSMRGFDSADSVCVAGEFNGWDPDSHPLRKRKDGLWATTLRLPRNGRLEFKYVVDGQLWVNDDEADASVPDPFGGRNSVLDLG
ncbi:MAG: isoamylase early set domain-containing protein [Acidobacteriota bacterium]|nr:MAG: isoamylase early set domain-containing protein [Acidobacteriota bacterium]